MILPIPPGAIELSERETKRVSAYRKKLDDLAQEASLVNSAMTDILLTVIERAGGDGDEKWDLSADMRCVIPRKVKE